jgi:TolB-like protein/Tfp pilus assembly protein PilF
MIDDAINFGPFCLDIAGRRLLREGEPVRLGSRGFDILCLLASARGEVVTKDALMAEVWPGQIVEENAIQVQVSALRKALDREGSGQDYILTVPGRGYRLVGSRGDVAVAAQAVAQPIGLLDSRSIAVLPFQNMSEDTAQEYFVDGMVDDIISGLARVTWLSVISRNSSFVYKNRTVDIRQVGRDLGVRYVLQGSVRVAEGRIRVAVQLVEAESGVNLWVERYDREIGDIFPLQDEIAMSVIGTIEPNLRKAELDRIKRKRPDSFDAYDLVLQAMPLAFSHMPDKALEAIPLLEKALELEPGYAAAHAPLALCYHARYGRAGLNEEDRAAAVKHARAAIVDGGDDAIVLGIAGFVTALDDKDQATALNLFDRALELSNSNALSFSCSALALSWMGKTDTAIERAQRALRLSPYDPLNYLAYNALSISYFHLKQYERSRDAARASIKSNERFGMSHAFLAAALVRLGCAEEPKTESRQAVKHDPNFSIRRFSEAAGLEPAVMKPFAQSWQEAGIPIE